MDSISKIKTNDGWQLEVPLTLPEYTALKEAYEQYKRFNEDELSYIKSILAHKRPSLIEVSQEELVAVRIRLAEAFINAGQVKTGAEIAHQVNHLIANCIYNQVK